MNRFIGSLAAVSAALMMTAPNAQEPTAEIPAEPAAPTEEKFKLVRTKAVAPQYPRKAFLDGREGWVDLMLTVGPDGTVQDVTVLEAEPKRVFERAAIRAAVKWRFEPPADSGITTNQTGRIRIHFRLEG